MNEHLKRELRKWADTGWDDVGLLGSATAAALANSQFGDQIGEAWKDWRARRASARSAIDSQIRNSSAAARFQKAAPDPYTAAARRMKARDLMSRTMAQTGLKSSEVAIMSRYGVKPGANPDIMRSYRELTARGASPKDAMGLARRYARQGRMGINGRMAASLPYNGIGRNVMMPNPELTAMQRGIGAHSNAKALFRPETIAADAELLRRAPKTGWSQAVMRAARPIKINPKAGRMFSKFKGFKGLRGGLKAGGIAGGSIALASLLAYLANSYVHRGDQGL